MKSAIDAKKAASKFAVVVDLGIITVPKNYDHSTQLNKFLKEKGRKFYGIKDANSMKPTRVLTAGEKIHASVIKQIVDGKTTSEERMSFLDAQKAVNVGAQGASLVFEQKHDKLPKNEWFVFFPGTPSVFAYSDGGFFFCNGTPQDVWRGDDPFICFNDL